MVLTMVFTITALEITLGFLYELQYLPFKTVSSFSFFFFFFFPCKSIYNPKVTYKTEEFKGRRDF